MKKKIKLEAWVNRSDGWITHYMEGLTPKSYNSFTRDSTYDIIKEIEIPDAPKRPREYWLGLWDHGRFELCDYPQASEIACADEVMHIFEFIEGSVIVTRDILKEAWLKAGGKKENMLLDDETSFFNIVCQSIGLKDRE